MLRFATVLFMLFAISSPVFSQYTGGSGGGSAMGETVGPTALPVELVAFSARLQNNAARVTWRTVTETNNYGFEVLRADGAVSNPAQAQWTVVTFVGGAGTSNTPRNYTVTDDLAGLRHSSREVTYRLRQIDRDGTTEYSPMVVLVLDASALTLRLDPAHPNPASTAAAALLTVPEALSASARVYSIDGREQLELFEQRQFDAGAHVVLVPRDGLVPGAYYLVVETPHTRLTQPLHFTP